jgi:uncharacterized phage protein gp47/JayE
MVQNAGAAVQGACATLIDLSVGSVVRAAIEASATIGLWVQWLIVLLLARQRLATCSGPDVDSFIGDYPMPARIASVQAGGTITLSRFSAGVAATVAVGTPVRTSDGSQSYVVIADPTNSLWSAGVGTAGGFIIPSGTFSANFLIQAVTPGSAGNAQANTVTLLGQSVAYIDTCDNAAALTGGIDGETDAQVKARFITFINSLSRGTTLAIENAVLSVQPGLDVLVTGNVDIHGNPYPGNFVVTVDDGSGDPPASLISAVYTAVDAVRTVTDTFNVQGPTAQNVTVTLTITAAVGYVKATLQPLVQTAIETFIDALSIGDPLSYSSIINVAYNAVPGVGNVTSLLVNGATADISPSTPTSAIKAGSVTVS